MPVFFTSFERGVKLDRTPRLALLADARRSPVTAFDAIAGSGAAATLELALQLASGPDVDESDDDEGVRNSVRFT
ncbi:MAG: hypothetical protein ACR2RL_13235 [Gammaproteobacteria bacterium]